MEVDLLWIDSSNVFCRVLLRLILALVVMSEWLRLFFLYLWKLVVHAIAFVRKENLTLRQLAVELYELR